MKRIQEAISSRAEKAMLVWIASRLPRFVTPDSLTIGALFGAFLTFAGLIASRWAPSFLFLSIFGLIVQNFGDSLDGTLARVRHIERPRYGFTVDHGSDILSQVLLALGFGLSPYVRLDCSLLALVGYLSVCTVSFQRLHVTGELKLSYNGVGPTEIRVVLLVGMLALYFFGPMPLSSFNGVLGVPDLVALALFLGGSFTAYSSVWSTAKEFAGETPGSTSSMR